MPYFTFLGRTLFAPTVWFVPMANSPISTSPFGIKFVLCPSARIIQNIIVFHGVIRIIPNDMVIKRPLPYGITDLFGYKFL